MGVQVSKTATINNLSMFYFKKKKPEKRMGAFAAYSIPQ